MDLYESNELISFHRELSSSTNGTSSVNAYLAIMLIFLAYVCYRIVDFYAEPGFPWHTYPTLMLGYFASFGILLLVPIDIASVVIARRSTTSEITSHDNYDRDVILAFYNTFFTIVLILGSVVLVFEEYYNSDVKGKLSSSFKRMCIENLPPLIVGGIILGILIGTHVVSGHADALKLTAIIITNTVYETFLMFLLGYALIEFPRSLWLDSDYDKYLLKTEMKASSEFKILGDAQLEVSLCCSDALKTQKMIGSKMDEEIKSAMSIIISECPPEFRSDRMGKVASNSKGEVNIDTLAALRNRLTWLKSKYRMSQSKVDITKIDAYNLEDIVQARVSGNNVIHWTLLDKDSTEWEYKWIIIYKPLLMKIAAVLCAALSILSFLGVICSMKGVSNQVSPYFLAVHVDTATEGGIAIFILLTLGYSAYIAAWAVFQMKIAYCMELHPHYTTSLSLSFNCRMAIRLAAPLAFFYLGWIVENGLVTGSWQYNDAPNVWRSENITYFNHTVNHTVTHLVNTSVSNDVFMPSSFANFYQLQNVGAVQKTFGTVFPVLLYCVLFLFLINAFNRILVLIKLEDYQFGAVMVTEDQLREGRRQLQRHKKATERTYRRRDLKSFITAVAAVDDTNSICSRFFCCFSSSNDNDKSSSMASKLDDAEKGTTGSSSVPIVREPLPMEGKGELKKEGTMTTTYKQSYIFIHSPGFLHIHKDEKTAKDAKFNLVDPSTSTDPTAIVIDLKTVLGISIPDKKSTDNVAVDISLGSETMRLKFPDHNKAVEWKISLQDWKDFNIDYGLTYPFGMEYARNQDKSNKKSLTATLDKARSNKAVASSAPIAEAEDVDSFEIDEDIDDYSGDKPFMTKSTSKTTTSGTGGVFSLRGKSSQSFTASTNPILLGNIGGGGNKSSKPTHSNSTYTMNGPVSSVDRDSVDKPGYLEGWVEKKGGGKSVTSGGWSKKYLRIDEKRACLSYYKGSSPTEQPLGSIDLKVVKDVIPYDKNGKTDYTRFNIEIDDKVYKFQVKSDTEGQKWINGLNEWRDYFLMNMNTNNLV